MPSRILGIAPSSALPLDLVPQRPSRPSRWDRYETVFSPAPVEDPPVLDVYIKMEHHRLEKREIMTGNFISRGFVR